MHGSQQKMVKLCIADVEMQEFNYLDSVVTNDRNDDTEIWRYIEIVKGDF